MTAAPACDVAACLAQLAHGEWVTATGVWMWSAPRCCGFGEAGPARARELLRGRRLVFLGDSTARRHMWAVADAVAGPRALRRRHGAVVPDSTRAFDEHAVTVNDTVYDSARAYHAGQLVLLNVDSGRSLLLDPEELCGRRLSLIHI